jgi:CotS family spore coat protein
MEQSRYRDKSYLVTYELTTDIFKMFGIIVDDIVPVRSVFMLHTDSGVKILKKINYSFDDLEFINSVIEHIYKNGYQNIIKFQKACDGNYYIKREDGIYTVLNLVDGREADFQNQDDVASVSRALCKLHKATRGLTVAAGKRDNLYKWISTFEKRAWDILKFKEIAELHEIKTGFDRVYLDFADKFYEDAVHSIKLLKASEYKDLCREVQDMGNICHHDLAYHNIIIDGDSSVHFGDFDNCIQDLRVHDIANLMVKSIKLGNWMKMMSSSLKRG